MVSKPTFLSPGGMEDRAMIKMKKLEFEQLIFRQPLQAFEDKKISLKKRENLLWILEEQHEERMQKKKRLPQKPRCPPPHKTSPRIEILLQIYQKTVEEFQRYRNFQLYQELLGYEVVAWWKSDIEKAELVETPMSKAGAT